MLFMLFSFLQTHTNTHNTVTKIIAATWWWCSWAKEALINTHMQQMRQTVKKNNKIAEVRGKRTECYVLLSWDSLKSFRRGRLSVQVKDLITALTQKRVEMGNSREVWQARCLTQPCGGTRGGQPHSQWSWRVWMNASRGTWGNRGSKLETGNWKIPLYHI